MGGKKKYIEMFGSFTEPFNSKSWWIPAKFFGGVGRFTTDKPFDFGADPDRDPDPEFFNRIFYHCKMGKMVRILHPTR